MDFGVCGGEVEETVEGSFELVLMFSGAQFTLFIGYRFYQNKLVPVFSEVSLELG